MRDSLSPPKKNRFLCTLGGLLRILCSRENNFLKKRVEKDRFPKNPNRKYEY